MSDTQQGKRRRRGPNDYVVSGSRAFLAACFLYIVVQLMYRFGYWFGIYQGALIAGGTGCLLGLIMEWLRRRGF